MSKFYRVIVTRTESTELYIETPDNFDSGNFLSDKLKEKVAAIASETTTNDDWDKSEWEDTVEVQSVCSVEENEAKKYHYGTLKSEG